jgi:hypothetical protein
MPEARNSYSVLTKCRRIARSESVTRGTVCGNSARTDLRESRVGNHPGRPSQLLCGGKTVDGVKRVYSGT